MEERDVGRFVVSLEHKGTEFCTGVLVSGHTVLTAAHCFLREKQIQDLSARIDDREHAIRSFTTLADADGKVSDEYLPNYDVAVLDIEPIEETKGSFPRLMNAAEVAASVGKEALIAGYGMTGSGQADHGTLRFGHTRIQEVNTEGRFTGLLVVDSGWQSGPCAGDSGGPLLVREQNQWLIAGLVHGVNWYSNPDFFGEDPCEFAEATYSIPGLFINPRVLADEGRVQLFREDLDSKAPSSWMDICQTQSLSREDLPILKLLTLKFRYKSCEEIEQSLLSKPVALDFGTTRLRSLRILNLIPRISILKADLSLVPDSGNPGTHLEEVFATVAQQHQLDFVLRSKHIKVLSLNQREGQTLDFAQLGNQTELVDIRLNRLAIAKLPSFLELKELTHLELSLNHLEDLNFLRGANKLQYLNASSNFIANITGMIDSKNLQTVVLSNNRIADLSPLKDLPLVQHLSLVNNPISQKLCPYYEEQEGDICAF